MVEGVPVATKRCPKCGEVKPVSEYYKKPEAKDGLQASCIGCQKLSGNARHAANRASFDPAVIPEFKVCYKCGIEKPASGFNVYRSCSDGLFGMCIPCQSHANWVGTLWREYRLTEDDYNTLFQNQGGVCAAPFCGCTPEENGERLSVDHCHATGVIRGLLCNTCNTTLGRHEDQPNAFYGMGDYLRFSRTGFVVPDKNTQSSTSSTKAEYE
jgi:hypothetical protein